MTYTSTLLKHLIAIIALTSSLCIHAATTAGYCYLSDITTTNVTLNWSATAGADNYIVQVKQNGNSIYNGIVHGTSQSLNYSPTNGVENMLISVIPIGVTAGLARVENKGFKDMIVKGEGTLIFPIINHNNTTTGSILTACNSLRDRGMTPDLIVLDANYLSGLSHDIQGLSACTALDWMSSGIENTALNLGISNMPSGNSGNYIAFYNGSNGGRTAGFCDQVLTASALPAPICASSNPTLWSEGYALNNAIATATQFFPTSESTYSIVSLNGGNGGGNGGGGGIATAAQTEGFDALVMGNPVRTDLNLKITGATTPQTLIAIYDINGQKLQEQNISTQNGTVQYIAIPTQYAAGNYFIHILNGDNQKTIHFAIGE